MALLNFSIKKSILTTETVQRVIEEIFAPEDEEERQRRLAYFCLGVLRFGSLSAAEVARVDVDSEGLGEQALLRRGIRTLSIPIYDEAKAAVSEKWTGVGQADPPQPLRDE